MSSRRSRNPFNRRKDRRRGDLNAVLGDMRTVFNGAPFRPLGLDGRWTGSRWFGGDSTSGDAVMRLELAHGEDPLGEAHPQLRVSVEHVSGPAQEDDLIDAARDALMNLANEVGHLLAGVRRAD